MANPSDTNVLVNDTFGDSYEVVKTVYNNLDTIKAVNENNIFIILCVKLRIHCISPRT